jgi:hypothetical protein
MTRGETGTAIVAGVPRLLREAHWPSGRSIRKMGGRLKVRAGAEGPRRAADGSHPSYVPGRCRGPSTPIGHRPPSHQGAARAWAGPVGCLERLNTPLPGVALAPGPASHLQWPGPGAPESRAPRVLPSRTPTPFSLPPHLTQANTSNVERPPEPLGESPLAAFSASSAPFWPLPPSPLSPPPHLLGGPDMAAVRRLRVTGATIPSTSA